MASEDKKIIIVSNIRLSIDDSVDTAFLMAKARLSKVTSIPDDIEFHIHKKSVDARKRNDVCFVYSIACTGSFKHLRREKLQANNCFVTTLVGLNLLFGKESMDARPVIVGAGPCGLFAALILSENGYRPIVIERGGDINQRVKAYKAFTKFGVLDENTNIQFGLGGAGTFSDGKLITRINDSLCSYILERFVEFGAPQEILYNAKPHIGTDILSCVVTNMADRIISLGGEIRYNTCLNGGDFNNQKISKIKTNNGDISVGALIMAPGHSARDTYEFLLSQSISIVAKNISVGMRIEHLTDDIDFGMYGKLAGHPALGHAEYALSHNTKTRGVYTFCMCPGGEVVAASSESGGVVVNGMSNSKRDGKNSNSAVVVSVFCDDIGNSPINMINFQRNIERNAFLSGGGNYSAPIITVGDFLKDKLVREPSRVSPTYRGGESVKLARPEEFLPGFVTDGLRGALLSFDTKIAGFACEDAVLTGAETRTSAPLRILRDEKSKLALGYTNFYPAGEGAGYAGGITSAAIDGVKVALSLMSKYKAYDAE